MHPAAVAATQSAYNQADLTRRLITPGDQVRKNTSSLEEVVSNSSADDGKRALLQDVRFMNQIGEELGTMVYPMAPSPGLFSPPPEKQSGRGEAVYKLDFTGIVDHKNKP